MSPSPRRRVVAAPARKPPVELRAIRIVFERDPEPYVDELGFDEKRLTDYRRGRFTLLIAHAEAEVVIEGITQILTSAWRNGIESDAEDEYFSEIIAEEWAELREVLKAIGVPTSELPLEVQQEWIDWRL